MRVAFLNPQGNFDNKDSYWTEHPDFGGQLVYVKELALAMDRLGIDVDIITRKIDDRNWPEFNSSIEYYTDSKVRIIRIPFGGRVFLNKEELWPHINEYVRGIIDFYEKDKKYPDFITAHYGDGGLAAAILKKLKKIPFSFTAHSLGAQKMDKLKVNNLNFSRMEKVYKFSKRIMAERIAMKYGSTIVVSTGQERDEQYYHRVYRDIIEEKKDKFRIISPGVNRNIFNFHGTNNEEEYVYNLVENTLNRDIKEERYNLPCIVASSRLDRKKNHLGLVKAYAHNIRLQQIANLIIVLRGVENAYEDYSNLKESESSILDEIMNLIKHNNLWGKVSFINLTNQKQLAAFYRDIANRKGIFSLTAMYEPFGLAPIEAMACGLPVVITKNGGPSEVLYENNKYFGVLVDPNDYNDIGKGLLKVLESEKKWDYYHRAGLDRVKNKYTWEKAAKEYIKMIEKALNSFGDEDEVEIYPWFMNPTKEKEDYFLSVKKLYLTNR